MPRPRPDLSRVDPSVRAYIEELEAELARLASTPRHRTRLAEDDTDDIPLEIMDQPAEEPTTMNVISTTRHGYGKRTPRHYYTRQHRAGMGVFELDTPDDDPPALLAIADESNTLLLFTNFARAFRLPVRAIPEKPLRARGENILGKIILGDGETLAAALPEQAEGYIASLSSRGFVRMLRHHVFGDYMKPGMTVFDTRSQGEFVTACWTPGDSDLLVVSQHGKAIRFSEKLLPPAGGQALRLLDGDRAVAVCAVYDDTPVFLLGADGRGAFRSMSAFQANKAPGAGGKAIMSNEQLIHASAFDRPSGGNRPGEDNDLMIISQLQKLIRFPAAEVPMKEGPVQGVLCMSLRADSCVAAVHT